MATNIDKALYEAPQGMMEDDEDEGLGLGVGLEIELPEDALEGGIEVSLGVDVEPMEDVEFDENLAEYLDDSVLESLANELVEQVESDITARKDWADTYVKGLDVLGLKYEERTEPWDDACGVYSTVLTEAAIRFQAESMSETFPAAGPVKTKIIGEATREKEEAAQRVKDDMNYQLTEEMPEYRAEHERMLYSLGLAGSAFKKVYFDPNLNRQVSVYIPAEDVIVPYGASHIQSAERVTHVMRKTKNEIAKLQAAGFYVSADLGEPQPFFSDIEKKKAEEGGYELTDDDRYTLYEIHADLIIDGVDEEGVGVEEEENEGETEGLEEPEVDEEEVQIAKPYVVTIERSTQKVLAIRRNWNPDDRLMLKRNHFVHYVYIPGFGFYGLGLIHIIGGYARAGTSLIRQLVDAGTLSNLPGGLKSRGLRIKGDDTPVGPGEFRDVDVPSGSIKDNIMPLPYKEPSQVLLALLNQITEEGRRLGAISDMNISDMSAQAPVGTTLALLERTLKPMAAVMSRVHYAMKMEFKLLKELIAEYAPTEYEYIPERGAPRARRQDYGMVDVIPVSDPNASTMAQKVVQYQAVMQMAQGAPQIYDMPYLHRQMIEVLGIKNAEKIIPMEDDATPVDPVSENMNALIGKPLKAFLYQDHDAHIATHMSFMQDPMIAQSIGQNPMAQQIMASLQAHIAEHLGFAYRKQIEEQLGVPLTAPNEAMPEEAEVLLSQLVAQAGQQLTQQHQQQAAQAQAQAQAQDPVFMLQQQEVQIKAQEVQRKAQKDQMDANLQREKMDLEKQKMGLETMKEGARVRSQEKQAIDRNKLEALRALSQRDTQQNRQNSQKKNNQ